MVAKRYEAPSGVMNNLLMQNYGKMTVCANWGEFAGG